MLRALFGFKGRLTRAEYALCLAIYVGFLTTFVFLWPDAEKQGGLRAVLATAVLVLALWIAAAALAKRMHDIGRSGWDAFYVFVPLIGQFIPVVMLAYPGETATNLYGRPRPGWFVDPD